MPAYEIRLIVNWAENGFTAQWIESAGQPKPWPNCRRPQAPLEAVG